MWLGGEWLELTLILGLSFSITHSETVSTHYIQSLGILRHVGKHIFYTTLYLLHCIDVEGFNAPKGYSY